MIYDRKQGYSVQLVGLSGYARSGKDTAADMLKMDGYQRLAFADVLREFALKINPLVGNGIRLSTVIDRFGWNHYKSTQYSEEIRGILQRLGTEAGRELISDTIWVDATLSKVSPNGKYVLTDCRFPNEADKIRSMGGKVVRIVRPGVNPVNAHVSETALDDYDFDGVVLNDSTPQRLRDRLLAIL